MNVSKPSGPRSVAIVGTYSSGKTTLLENILHITGATHRKGSVDAGNTVGDSSPEARAHGMSVEVNIASAIYLDDPFTFIDCPGSVEFLGETLAVLNDVDAAVVVCEPQPEKLMALKPILRYLVELRVPHLLFVNKVEKMSGPVAQILDALQTASDLPVVLRQIPITRDGTITGYVDLASERCYLYREAGPSERIDLPPDLAEKESEARFAMLEQLADYDDHLMEELLEDIEPSSEEVFADLAQELAEGLILPVMLGAAETGHGVRRLLKALRHEVPPVERTAARVGVPDDHPGPVARVIKTLYTGQGGKLSIARLLRGSLKDGDSLNGHRAAGLFQMHGQEARKIDGAKAGEVVALGRMEDVQTGDVLTIGADAPALTPIPRPDPVYAMAVSAVEQRDDVKLSSALGRLCEEDPSLSVEHDQDLQQTVLWGQGDIHLKVAKERLKSRFGLDVEFSRPAVPYREAIRKGTEQHTRYKRQSGGHGQFADVVVRIRPLPRGSGFLFENEIVGGAIPKQFIPAVEAGIREALSSGPLGFPVVDLAVTLVDGKYHSVDSSEQSFKIAGRQVMAEALKNCSPVLLEPVMKVEVFVPSEATAAANNLITGRRGQILGFDAREGWKGWDQVTGLIPQAEMHDLIVELRSSTMGVGTFRFRFDHLQELTGRLAEEVLEANKI